MVLLVTPMHKGGIYLHINGFLRQSYPGSVKCECMAHAFCDYSPIWPEYPMVHSNGVTTPYHSPYHALFANAEQSPYDKDPMPSSPYNSSFNEIYPPNMNWLRVNEEIHPSLTNTSRYMPNETSKSQENQVYAKPFNIYDYSTSIRDNTAQVSNVYTGVIKHSRVDFITEEPYKKRTKKASNTPAIETTLIYKESPQQKTTKETSDTSDASDPIIKNLTGCKDTEKHVDSSDINDLTTSDQSQHQERTSYESSSSLETYMIERPTTDPSTLPYTQTSSMAPMLPNINTFTAPYDQYGYHGMTCFPLMYPAALPPYLQYYHVFPNADPYFLLRERYKDIEPSIFPTFIQPKPFTSTMPYRPFTEALPPPPPYPNPAAMFRAANLIPFVTSSSSPSKPVTAASISSKEPPAKGPNSGVSGYRHYNIQPKQSSQAQWLKADNTFNYTITAAPSEVMTYLPQTSREESDDEDDDTTDDCDSEDDNEEPCFLLSELVSKPHKSVEDPPSRKPHVCDICGKTYARAFTLKTHKRVHTGERPYTCKVCHKKFAQGGGLDSHMRFRLYLDMCQSQESINTKCSCIECVHSCPEACKYSEYETKLSTAHLSAKTLVSEANDFCKTDKKNTNFCLEIKNKSHEEKIRYFRENVLSIEVYLKDIYYDEIEQVASFKEFALISSIGGNLGLFLGMSILTIAEFVDFTARSLWSKFSCSKTNPVSNS
ncbi:hypothetical protein QZH41_000711 [Actinostola sp. cb2023]|nr:hypothetical protein QZH41_000711 [Actinostola sp. cb2023]